jgi:hypothetical protein
MCSSITLLNQLSSKMTLTVGHYCNSPSELVTPAILQDLFPWVWQMSWAQWHEKNLIAQECPNWVHKMIVGIQSRCLLWATTRSTCCWQLSPSAMIIVIAEDQCIRLWQWSHKQTVNKSVLTTIPWLIDKFWRNVSAIAQTSKLIDCNDDCNDDRMIMAINHSYQLRQLIKTLDQYNWSWQSCINSKSCFLIATIPHW